MVAICCFENDNPRFTSDAKRKKDACEKDTREQANPFSHNFNPRFASLLCKPASRINLSLESDCVSLLLFFGVAYSVFFGAAMSYVNLLS